jgi:ATP-dependent RNA circularization protein (DNA/RNA ligase family)
MKRVKAACILQTLAFMQKEDCGLNKKAILEANHREVENYKKFLERSHIRHQIVSEEEQEDGSIIVRVRKQYNDKADISEYFC